MKLTLDTLDLYCERKGGHLLWLQGVQGQGYPQARIDGRSRIVSRWLVEQTRRQPIPRGYVVANCCGLQRCLMHLKVESYSDRMRRMYASGERNARNEYASRLERSIEARHIVGGVLAKLTREQVEHMRSRAREPVPALAREFGVCASTVRDILQRRTWREGARPVRSAAAKGTAAASVRGGDR